MNQSKAIVSVSAIVTLLFSLASAFCLFSLYRSLTGVSIRGRTDVQTAALLVQMREKLRDVKTAKDAEYVMKSLDGIPPNIMTPSRANELKNLYKTDGGANKEQNFDAAEIYKAKTEAITQLFNFYRQQVVRRNLAIASVLSGIIADAHSVLLKDQKSDINLAFIRRAKEQLDSLKSLANGFGDARDILERAKAAEQSLNIFSNATKQQIVWEKQREELYKSAENVISSMMSEISGRLDHNVDNLQRDFLLAVFLYLVSLIAVVIAVVLGSKRANYWFTQRANVLVKYLLNFGNNADGDGVVDTRLLQIDNEWNNVLAEVRRAENNFRGRSAAEIALSKCLSNPFVVFNPSRKAVFWNSHASRILNISSRDEVDELSMEEFFSRSGLIRRKEALSELVGKTQEGKETYMQLQTRHGNEMVPVEVGVFPVQVGILKGGFVVIFREMKEEERRISDRLLSNFKIVDQLLDAMLAQKDAKSMDVDLAPVPEQVLPLVEKIKRLRVKVDERESLWSSEVEAVWEQIKKEEEILHKLATELSTIKTQNDGLADVAKASREAGNRLQALLSAADRRVSDGFAHWKRIIQDIDTKSTVAEKALAYEQSVRSLLQEMNEWKEGFNVSLVSVRKCKDWVRLHAVNLNVGGSQGQETFRDRARKFSIAMSEFYDRLEGIESELQGFLRRHPGASAVSSLEAGVDLRPLMEEITGAYTALQADVDQWKSASAEIQSLAERIAELSLQTGERKREIDTLKEACLRVNDSALKGLERWV